MLDGDLGTRSHQLAAAGVRRVRRDHRHDQVMLLPLLDELFGELQTLVGALCIGRGELHDGLRAQRAQACIRNGLRDGVLEGSTAVEVIAGLLVSGVVALAPSAVLDVVVGLGSAL